MVERDYRDYLQDIVDSIIDTESFTESMTFEDFLKDKKTLNAVIRSIEIIGEASKNLSEEIKSKYAAIPWREIVSMRNRIAHEYFGIDYEIVWEIVRKDLPELKPKIEEILKDLNNKK